MTELLTWKHLDFTDPEDAGWIRTESGIPTIIVNALLDEDSRPRVVEADQGVLVILRGVNLNSGSEVEDMVSIRIWLERDRIISTGRRQLRSVEQLQALMDSGKGPQTPGSFLLQLSQELAEHVTDVIDQIEVSLSDAEVKSNDPATFAKNSPYSVLRRQTARIRRYLSPQKEALDRLSKSAHSILRSDDLVQFREQANHLTLILEDLDLVRERALVAQEELLGIMAHEQNSRMLLLSIVAAIFLPLSFLTGLMGMNVAGLPGTENNWAFWSLVLLMLLITAAILALFRIRRWF